MHLQLKARFEELKGVMLQTKSDISLKKNSKEINKKEVKVQLLMFTSIVQFRFLNDYTAQY